MISVNYNNQKKKKDKRVSGSRIVSEGQGEDDETEKKKSDEKIKQEQRVWRNITCRDYQSRIW